MPTEFVKKVAKEKGISVDKAEKYWKKAKEIAKDQYDVDESENEKFYSIVTGIFKKMTKMTEEVVAGTQSGDIAVDKPIKKMPDGLPCFECDDDTFWHLHQNVRKDKQWWNKFYGSEIATWGKVNKGKPFYIQHQNEKFIRKIYSK